MDYYPEVVQAVAMEDKCIAVYFSDGHIKKFDVNPLISGGGVFSVLENDSVFRDCLTVINGTAAWSPDGSRDETTCFDLDPFVLYKARDIKDPLAEKTA